MGEIKKQKSVKLFIGFIFSQKHIFEEVKSILIKKFGKIDFESRILDFKYTNYYEDELGKNLKRKFISFKKLINPKNVSNIKIFANKIEKKFSMTGKRLINIDPGYLELAKVVLLTTKDYVHRIYLDKGIFAEITLFYQDNAFKTWPWTYPDYKTPAYLEIFERIRHIYQAQIKK